SNRPARRPASRPTSSACTSTTRRPRARSARTDPSFRVQRSSRPRSIGRRCPTTSWSTRAGTTASARCAAWSDLPLLPPWRLSPSSPSMCLRVFITSCRVATRSSLNVSRMARRSRCSAAGSCWWIGSDLGVLLWLLVIDVFLFTQSAGPGVAAVCALVCLPTTAFGLLVVRRMDRNHKEPWRLVLVAAAWGAIVATSLVVWGETIWEQSAQHALVPGPGLDTSLAFMAGILEELAKGLAVLMLFLIMRNEFDDVVDGI